MTLPVQLALVSAALFTLFVVLCGLTVGLAAIKRAKDKRQARIHEAIREELFDKQQQDTPAWEQWVSTLSSEESEVLASILNHYLRLVKGSQEKDYLEVADALSLGEQADAALDDSAVVPRLHALATLAVINYPLSIDRLTETCTDSRIVREAAARLLYERRNEYDSPAEWGTQLLIWDGQDPLSVYGLETLAALNTGRKTPVLSYADALIEQWEQSVIVQICIVLEHSEQVDPNAPLDWIYPLLDHKDPTVRSAAIRAFKQHGWRQTIRTRIDFPALISDPSEQVRQATYEVLTYWGDDDSQELLEWATVTESDERCQLTGIRGLLSMDVELHPEDRSWPEPTWQWLQAELNVTDRQRLSSQPNQEIVS